MQDRDITIWGKTVNEYITVCPVCGEGAMRVRIAIHNIPNIGNIVIESRKCTKCGYTHTYTTPMEVREGIRITFRVEKEDDLSVKVIRSPFATLKIPELGLEIKPGPLATMFITNIEGIIERARDIGRTYLTLATDEEEYNSSRLFLEKVEEVKRSTKFTIVIEDPLGLSDILVQNDEQKKRIKKEVVK